MKAITAKWFECKVSYDKTLEDGTQKKVSEKYIVDAVSFTEAESTIIREMTPFIQGEFEIKGIVPQTFKEVVFTELEQDDKWYKVKVAFITIDEKTEKEKRFVVPYLIQANSTDAAISTTNEYMHSSMIDYEIVSAVETKVLDVYLHQSPSTEEEE